jgi:hypothetical protein
MLMKSLFEMLDVLIAFFFGKLFSVGEHPARKIYVKIGGGGGVCIRIKVFLKRLLLVWNFLWLLQSSVF